MKKLLIFCCLIGWGMPQSTWAQSWKVLDSLTTSAFRSGDAKSALGYAKQAADRAKREFGKRHENYFSSLNNIAFCQMALKDHAAAEKSYQKNLQIIRKALGETNSSYALQLFNLGGMYQTTNRFAEAETNFKEALRLRKLLYEKDKLPQYASSLRGLAAFYSQQARPAEAEPLFLECLEVLAATGRKDGPEYAQTLTGLAIMQESQGRFPEARQLHDQILGILAKLPQGKERPDYALQLSFAANSYFHLGQYLQAEQMLNESAQLLAKKVGKDNLLLTNPLFRQVEVYRTLGRYREAQRVGEELCQLIEKRSGRENVEYARALNYLATVHIVKTNFKEADSLLQASLAIYERTLGKNHPNYAVAQGNLALVYQKTDRFAEAEGLYQALLPVKAKARGENSADYLVSLNNLATMYLNQGKMELAESTMIRVRDGMAKGLGQSHPSYLGALNNLAYLYKTKGDFAQAETMFAEVMERAITLFRRQSLSFSEQEKGEFRQSLDMYFSNFNSLVLAASLSGKPQDAATLARLHAQLYDNVLFSKSLLLNNSYKMRAEIANGKNVGLKKLHEEWLLKRSQLARAYSQGTGPADAAQSPTRPDPAALELEANELEKQLFAQANTDPTVYHWPDVQKQLKRGEAAVEIVRAKIWKDTQARQYDTTYFALVLTSDQKPQWVSLGAGRWLERASFRAYQLSLSEKRQPRAKSSGRPRPQPDEPGSIFDSLYDRYWKPIANKLPGIKKVYFSPDGVYHQLNLLTLWNPATGRYLADEGIDIHLLTSTRDLAEPALASGATKGNLAVLIGRPQYNLSATDLLAQVQQVPPGNRIRTMTQGEAISQFLRGRVADLPATEVEISQTAAALKARKWKVESYLGAAALEEVVKNVSSPRVLHIATHGYYLPPPSQGHNSQDDPLLYSGLLLAGVSGFEQATQKPDTEDGVLTAYEAQGLRLTNTELVVLSACQTGLGKIEDGEGVYGLQRAFRVAGASNIMMSLWRVADQETQALMTHFYTEWLKGGSQPNDKHRAFRAAQAKLRKQRPEPFYWGCFVMVGK